MCVVGRSVAFLLHFTANDLERFNVDCLEWRALSLGVTVALKSPSLFLSRLFSAYTFFLPPVLSRTLPLSCSHRLPPFLVFSFSLSMSALRCCHSVSEQVESITDPQQPAPLPQLAFFLIEGINEWSACEMIWCHGSRLAVCREGKLGGWIVRPVLHN